MNAHGRRTSEVQRGSLGTSANVSAVEDVVHGILVAQSHTKNKTP